MNPLTSSGRVLVTGGLGFIGSNLCRLLLAENPGIHLTIVDDLSGTPTDWSDLATRAEVVIGDLRAIDPRIEQFDAVWHLASPVGSLGILERTGAIASDIIDLATHAYHLAESTTAPLLYVSSSEVYGRDGQHDEEVEVIVPPRRGARMEYALGKLTAEHVLFNRSTDSGVPLYMVRPFNCAGPGQSTDLGFVIPTFVAAALAGDELPVHNDGGARRAFCHVSDMVAGLVAVRTQGHPGQLYNVGQPDGVLSILELANFVVDHLESSSTVSFVDPRQRYGKHWIEAFDKVPDITRVSNDTGWQPQLSLGRIIDDVADHLRRASDEPLALEGRSRTNEIVASTTASGTGAP